MSASARHRRRRRVPRKHPGGARRRKSKEDEKPGERYQRRGVTIVPWSSLTESEAEALADFFADITERVEREEERRRWQELAEEMRRRRALSNEKRKRL